jgi:uncharacterized protein
MDIDIKVRILNDGIRQLDRDEWNALNDGGNPFLDYDWLYALEQSGCANAREGWQPLHLVVENIEGRLLAAVPLYAKYHSYGEFIFDQSWANFAQTVARIKYYPKLLAAVPFTPASGSRILLSNSLLNKVQQKNIGLTLAHYMKQLASDNQLSGSNVNFISDEQIPLFQDAGYMLRQSIQYRWINQRSSVEGNEQKLKDISKQKSTNNRKDVCYSGCVGDNNEPFFEDFDDYLLSFKSKRRTQIRRERRSVYEEQGIKVKVVKGDDPLATREFYQKMFELYTTTVTKMWGQQYLSSAFFDQLWESSDAFKSKLVFIVAYVPYCIQKTKQQQDILEKFLDMAGMKDIVDSKMKENKEAVESAQRRSEGGNGGDGDDHDDDPYNPDKIVAGTINLVGDDTFYGRYWGAFEMKRNLHFECCYYKTIEYCIENKLAIMSPGAGGGEFKFLRGFDPFLVNSLHAFGSPVLQKAVGEFLAEEREYNQEIQEYLLSKSATAASSATTIGGNVKR